MRKLNHFFIGVFSVVSVCSAVVLLMPADSLAWDSQKLIICHITEAGDEETRVLSKYAARRHLENHPDDTAGICPVACVGTEPPPLENCPCSGQRVGNAVWGPDFPADICSTENGNISLSDDGASTWLSVSQGDSTVPEGCAMGDRASGVSGGYDFEGPGQRHACIVELLKIAEERDLTCGPND
jgi:hypothetical protein